MEDRLNFDISLLDTDPLVRGDMVNGLRLFHEDFPAGLRHHHRPGDRHDNAICQMIDMKMLILTDRKVSINPEFAQLIMGKHDQRYVDAIKGWVAYSAMVDEVEAASGNG